jgi:hypothetical protein
MFHFTLKCDENPGSEQSTKPSFRLSAVFIASRYGHLTFWDAEEITSLRFRAGGGGGRTLNIVTKNKIPCLNKKGSKAVLHTKVY